MKKVSNTRERSNAKDRVKAYKESVQGDFEFSTRLTLIQQLIPSVLMAVKEILQEEVTHFAGEHYGRGGTRQRRRDATPCCSRRTVPRRWMFFASTPCG